MPERREEMLVQQARSVHWKKWAAKHDYEEMEGIWLEPYLALLRKKTNEEWTETHRNVARKLFLEGGCWEQKKLFDIGWSDKCECETCHKEEGTDKRRLHHCPDWHEVRR